MKNIDDILTYKFIKKQQFETLFNKLTNHKSNKRKMKKRRNKKRKY